MKNIKQVALLMSLVVIWMILVLQHNFFPVYYPEPLTRIKTLSTPQVAPKMICRLPIPVREAKLSKTPSARTMKAKKALPLAKAKSPAARTVVEKDISVKPIIIKEVKPSPESASIASPTPELAETPTQPVATEAVAIINPVTNVPAETTSIPVQTKAEVPVTLETPQPKPMVVEPDSTSPVATEKIESTSAPVNVPAPVPVSQTSTPVATPTTEPTTEAVAPDEKTQPPVPIWVVKEEKVIVSTEGITKVVSVAKEADVVTSKAKANQKSDNDLFKINGEIGYFWGCLDMFGKCQGFGGSLDIFNNSKSKNKFGLEIGAELTTANLLDTDSDLKRLKYIFLAGLAYKFEPSEQVQLSTSNGIMYESTEDEIASIGGFSLAAFGVDANAAGINTALLNFNFKRSQSGILYYNKLDYSRKFDSWRTHLGTELRIPLHMKFSTELPPGSLGASKLDQKLGRLIFGIQKKIGEETYLGIETDPVYYAGETGLFGEKTSLAINYKRIYFEGGILMNPYGLPQHVKAQGGSFEKMMNAFIALKVKF